MTTAFLAADIAAEEGRENDAYPDPLSPLGRACARAKRKMRDYRTIPGWASLDGAPWTIGVGCTGKTIGCGVHWSDAQIDLELALRIHSIEQQLDHDIAWWRGLSGERQDVLVQMAFQLGVHGLEAFRNTLEAVRTGRFAAAAVGMTGSAWARQTPERANRLADQMRTGVRSR